MTRVNTEFWQAPPWRDGKPHFRLGLKPVEAPQWLRHQQAPDAIVHARGVLEDHYEAVVPLRVDTRPLQQRLFDVLVKNAEDLISQSHDRYPDPLANLTAATGDDICIIDVRDDLRLIAACVTAPSYWDVQAKIDHPLHHVHSPVTGMNAKIGASIDRFFHQLPLDGAFARQNWFIHADGDRRHVKDNDVLSYRQARWSKAMRDPSQWTLRSERQMLWHFAPGYVAFFIRVLCEPMQHLLRFPHAQVQLLQSLEGFSPAEIDHFGRDKYLCLREHLARWTL